MSTIPTSKVFISYSWTSEAHVTWVEALATRLQSEGVEVVLDRWDLKRGHDKYAFMEKMFTDPSVKKVLAICDSKYAAKADGREGGVGTESQIISPQVYAKTQQEKFIPIVRERDAAGDPYLPTFFSRRSIWTFRTTPSSRRCWTSFFETSSTRPQRSGPRWVNRLPTSSRQIPYTSRRLVHSSG